MPIVHKGSRDATGLRFGIIVSRFNSVVTDRLLNGALQALRQHGANDERIHVAHVPGAFEIPLFAESLAASGKFDALLCLGAIVRGDTQHHDYLAKAVFDTLQDLQVSRRIPIALGILTTENMEQALQRSGDDSGNKGFEAAQTAIECATLLRQLG